MKVWKKILCVLLVIVVILAGLAFWQRDNLRALWEAAHYSSEELAGQLEDNQKQIQDAVDANPDVSVRPMTEEEQEAFLSGVLSREELIKRLLGESDEAISPLSPTKDSDSSSKDASQGDSTKEDTKGDTTENPKTPTTPSTPDEPQNPANNGYEKQLSSIVAEVYVLQAEYTGALNSLFASAKAEYLALPADQRTQSSKVSIASKYMGQASALEGQCDAKMDGIVSSMRSVIQANGGDMSLVDTVVHSYASEKSLKKSWYMSQLG